MINPDELERAVERLEKALTIADQYADSMIFGETSAGILSFKDLRLILSANREMREKIEGAAKYLCRLEGALLADDLDMKLNFPGEKSPTAMAESIMPGFDSIEYDLARSALTTQRGDGE